MGNEKPRGQWPPSGLKGIINLRREEIQSGLERSDDINEARSSAQD